jgi:hypothetical protein
MDQEQFEAMLARNGVTVSKWQDKDNPEWTVVEIAGGEKVDTFSHCFCEFRFTADGELARISFGY